MRAQWVCSRADNTKAINNNHSHIYKKSKPQNARKEKKITRLTLSSHKFDTHMHTHTVLTGEAKNSQCSVAVFLVRGCCFSSAAEKNSQEEWPPLIAARRTLSACFQRCVTLPLHDLQTNSWLQVANVPLTDTVSEWTTDRHAGSVKTQRPCVGSLTHRAGVGSNALSRVGSLYGCW